MILLGKGFSQNNFKTGFFSSEAKLSKSFIQDPISSGCDKTTVTLHRTNIWLQESENYWRYEFLKMTGSH